MSRWSGKADFADSLWMSAENEEEAFAKFNGTKLYIYQPLPDDVDFVKALKDGVNIPETYYKKVEYHSIKDLIPLYPHLISMAYYNKSQDGGSSIVILSPDSHVDREEQELLEFYLKNLIKVYNRCKRKKIEFDIKEAVRETCWLGHNRNPITKLAYRVKEKGRKASIEGIHLSMQEYYRKQLADEMLKHGIDPCKYGYERFIKNKEVNKNESIEEQL